MDSSVCVYVCVCLCAFVCVCLWVYVLNVLVYEKVSGYRFYDKMSTTSVAEGSVNANIISEVLWWFL